LLYRGQWTVFTASLAHFNASGASGWVFGVLLLPTRNDLGWSRSAVADLLTIERPMRRRCLAPARLRLLLASEEGSVYLGHRGIRDGGTRSSLSLFPGC